MNGRNIKLLTISDESLIRNQIPQELDYLLIRDGKLFQYFNEFTEIQNILKIHIKRLTIFHCVSNTDSLLKVIQNLIQYGSLEAIELIDSNLDGDNVMKLIQLCQYKQLEKRCSCQGNREDDADLYDVALVGAMNSDKGCCHDNGPASLDDIVLEQSRGVTSLLLENMRISDYVARSLGNQLKNWKNLKKFSLRSCIFSDNNCSTAILQGLIDSCYLGGLKHLEISDLAFLPKDHVVSLLKSLIRCKNCCLQILILEYIGWTSYSSTAFPGFFSRQSFSDVPRQFELTQYINLSGINFQCSSDVWCLCYLIHCDTALRYLTLGDCHLLPIHLNQIFQTVRESRLETLDVSGNRYDEDENDALSELLRNGGLRRLNLNACHIHGILSTKLIKALQANTKLKMLWIAENRLGDEGLAMLAGIFEKPDSRSALEVLDISRNCISKEGFLRFATLLQPSKESIKLQEIVVYGNWLKEDKENIKTVEKTLGEIIPTVRISTMYQATRDSFKAEHVSQM
ncbi:leucine-rich repeat-containing protein 41-like [Glandiceps talaboti]